MSEEKELILYRGIYTDDVHTDIIRQRGFDNDWKCNQNRFLFTKDSIRSFLNKPDLTMDDVVDKNDREKAFFACATERDACFYAIRNIKHEYAQNLEKKHIEVYTSPRKPYIIKFKAKLKDVYIDGNDSLFPMAYKPEKWKKPHPEYDKLCQLFTENIVKMYAEKLITKKSDSNFVNALVNLLQAEDEAIMAFYRNKDILIYGKRDVELFSSFRVYSDVTEKDIIEVKSMTEEECVQVKYDIRPKMKLSIHDFYK